MFPERVFVAVGHPEDVESSEVESDNGGASWQTEVDGVESEEPRLDAVCERNPDEVAKGQHVAETIGRDVHLGQHGCLGYGQSCTSYQIRRRRHGTHLEPLAVGRVEELESDDQPHAIGHSAVLDILLAEARDVEQRPEDQTGSIFVESFDVKVGESGPSRVQRSADEELRVSQRGGASISRGRDVPGKQKAHVVDEDPGVTA